MLCQLASPNLSLRLQVCMLWQRMKETSFKILIKMEWEVLKGALSCITTQDTLQTPTGSTPFLTFLHRKIVTIPAGSREIFYLPHNRPSHWETVMNRPMESHYASIPGFLQWTFYLQLLLTPSFILLPTLPHYNINCKEVKILVLSHHYVELCFEALFDKYW